MEPLLAGRPARRHQGVHKAERAVHANAEEATSQRAGEHRLVLRLEARGWRCVCAGGREAANVLWGQRGDSLPPGRVRDTRADTGAARAHDDGALVQKFSEADEGLTLVASASHSSPETEAFVAKYPGAQLKSLGSSLKLLMVAE
eukprot:814751-Prymnesium_polylepis.1